MVFCFCAGFAQKKQFYGIWIEYKREVAGDTAISKYALDGKLHPKLYFSVTKKDFIYTDVLKTDLFEYVVSGDTLTLAGFDKKIFTRTFRFKKTGKKELILTELLPGKDSTLFSPVHYLRRSRHYPQQDKRETYVLHQEKDQYPQFPGGLEALKAFYKQNYKQPALMDTLSYEPVVKVMLTINDKGNIINAEIMGQPLKEYAEEAMRLIRLMPAWDMGPQPYSSIQMPACYLQHTYTCYPIEIVFRSKM